MKYVKELASGMCLCMRVTGTGRSYKVDSYMDFTFESCVPRTRLIYFRVIRSLIANF